MKKIDAHQHFWQFNESKHDWIDDSMAVLKKDFTPPELMKELEANGIDGCVAVQADQSEEETDFLLELSSTYDFIKGVVGWVDLRSGQLEERLEYYSGFEKLKGFRHVVQMEPDLDFMTLPDFVRGVSMLTQFDLTYDILIFEKQLPAAIALARLLPNQKFVLDHIAKPKIKYKEIEPWGPQIKELAEYENVCCKISGLVTEADWSNWTQTNFEPYLDLVVESFGVDRLMFGSDWPVCLLGGSYDQIKGIVDNKIDQFPIADQAKVMGGNAIKFYNL